MIRNTQMGEAAEIAEDLYVFRLPKHRYRAGQSYALRINGQIVLIDAVHEVTKAAVDKVLTDIKAVALLLTHSDLLDQAWNTPGELSGWLDCPVYIHPHDAGSADVPSVLDAVPMLEKLGLSIHHVPGHTPGSVMFYQKDRQRLFTGDSAIGDNYESKQTEFTHPPINDGDWDAFAGAWEQFSEFVTEVYPLHGKPATAIEDFETIKQHLTRREHVMKQ